jgi:tetratricopeptide (TPR) repeat protein
MLRLAGVAGLALMVAACAAPGRVRDDGERVRNYNEDGVRLYQRGDYAHARECFQAALVLRPGDAGMLYNLGRCHDMLGQTPKAEQTYARCLQSAPNHPECRHSLAVLLVRQSRADEAAQMVEDWLQREPRLAAAYAEQAYLYREAGDLVSAQRRLQQALALDPNDASALTELAQVYEAQHRPDRALALYERALDANPRRPDLAQRVSLLKSQGTGRPLPD